MTILEKGAAGLVIFMSIVLFTIGVLIGKVFMTIFEIRDHARDIEECKEVLKFLEGKNLYEHKVFINCDNCGGWEKIVKSRHEDLCIVDEMSTLLPDGREICSKCTANFRIEEDKGI